MNRTAEPQLAASVANRPLWQRGGFWLLLIVALAVCLRFWNLASPGIWGDEAATYGRVNGSYNELLEVLQYDGFMPLHYQIYWVLARFLVLDPWWMRLWPAVTGALTVPAVYFLARQLLSRPAALVATLLAATSAYLLYYSRDAKMYAPLWLFTTLSMGCFLAWLRERSTATGWQSRAPFWGWMAASTAAVGIHAPVLLVIAVQPLIFTAMPGRSWKRLFGLVLGLAVIATGPAVHYGYFNRWYDRIREEGWNASMLQWVQWYNQGRDLPELARFTASAYATAWEWPDKPRDRLMVDPKWLARWEWATLAIGVAVLAGVLPWRRIGHWVRRGVPRPPPMPDHHDRVSWPCVWVLAVWVVVPAYGIYVISYADPAPPWALPGWTGSHGSALAVATVTLLGAVLSMGGWRCMAQGLLVLALLFGLCAAVYFGVRFDRTHHLDLFTLTATPRDTPKPVKMLWMPRYLGVVYPAVLIAGTALLMRLPLGLREVAIAGVVLVNLGNFGFKVIHNPEPPIARIITELWDDRRAQQSGQPKRVTFVPATFGHGFEPGAGSISGVVGRYHYSLQLTPPLAPAEFRTGWGVVERGLALRSNLRPQNIRNEVQRAGPTVETIVLWERGDPRVTDRRDPLQPALGPGWTLARVDTWDTYDHWMWRYLAQIRRFEYTRSVPIAAAP